VQSGPVLAPTSALLVIDAQRAFTAGPDWPPRLARIAAAAAAFRAVGAPVVFTQEVHRAGGFDFGRELDGAEGPHCLEGDPDTELALDPAPGDHLLVKRRYSCFYNTDLEILLRALGVGTLVLAGALTDVCVHYTAVDAHQRDFVVRVLTDCVAGSGPAAHEAALCAITYLQRDALLTSAALPAPLAPPVPAGVGG